MKEWEVRYRLLHGSRHVDFFHTKQDALDYVKRAALFAHDEVNNVLYCDEYENPNEGYYQ